MNARAWRQLEKLDARCAEALRDPRRQSASIFRGDMWAIIGACHDVRKAREKARAAGAVDPQVGDTSDCPRAPDSSLEDSTP